VIAPRAALAVVAGLLAACGTTEHAPPTSVPPVTKAPASPWVTLSPLIQVDRAAQAVEFRAVSVIEAGFLEEYVCTVGTREHESLFAFDGKASEIHAAMLLAGFTPGSPGHWREVDSGDGRWSLELVPPTGDRVAIAIRMPDGGEHPLEWFVQRAPLEETGNRASEKPREARVSRTEDGPPSEFTFAGSEFRKSRRQGVEFYAADASGSLIGLVTFGDETIAPIEVIPDQASAAEPVWEVRGDRMPPPGTVVTICLRRP
jgi:hypothetical protein